jgi:surfactin synthase thioesterase subunit
MSSWLTCWRAKPSAPVRVICFPRAGAAGNSYFPLSRQFEGEAELSAVELPGRWSRPGEIPPSTLPALVDALMEALRPMFDRRVVFLGYSFGGIVAFELARKMRAELGREPSDLFILARGAPSLAKPMPEGIDPEAPDRELLAKIIEVYGPFPGNAHLEPDLLEIVMGPLRSDLRLLRAYAYREEAPLGSAIHVFGGREDRVTTEASLGAWRAHTTGTFELKMLPGGHYFLDAQLPTLARHLAWVLDES